ncbi:unnamed protein product [Moneuplotes crassus]|uniref:BZIP domain-containing protein n=1 Tax=Euplotes crassus TaxID=5936 RepID=A0AAD1X532_EUPCR|nr:unnamed protein product [Moneuplotes crassus]
MTKQDCEWKISESHVRKPKKRGRKKMDEEERKIRRLHQNRVSALKCRQKKKNQYEKLVIEKNELIEKAQQMELRIKQLTLQFNNERIQKESLLERVTCYENLQKGVVDTHSTHDSKFTNEEDLNKQSLLTSLSLTPSFTQKYCWSSINPTGQCTLNVNNQSNVEGAQTLSSCTNLSPMNQALNPEIAAAKTFFPPYTRILDAQQ